MPSMCSELETFINANESQLRFWVKPIGRPDKNPDVTIRYDNEHQELHFADDPAEIAVGDIIFVYRIGISKLLYAASAVSKRRYASETTLKNQPWRSRWPWELDVLNLTTDYGWNWNALAVKPFAVDKDLTFATGRRPQLGSIQHGADKCEIDVELARHFVVAMLDAIRS